jgi:hypothetical protein
LRVNGCESVKWGKGKWGDEKGAGLRRKGEGRGGALAPERARRAEVERRKREAAQESGNFISLETTGIVDRHRY